MTHLDTRVLRNAFGSFMTGVTVITTRDANDTPLGFTANSFSSVSLDPPLLLFCPGKFLSSYKAFATFEHFAVNVLAEGQEDVSNTFASYNGDRFARVPHQLDANAMPLIDGATAQFSCTTLDVLDAGDHCVLIGRVDTFQHQDKAGLGYAGGKYFSLGLERQVADTADKQAVCGALIEVDGKILLEQVSEGFQPPHIRTTGRSNLRKTLHQALDDKGISVSLGAAYSVFDDATTHYSYILATASKLPQDNPFFAVPAQELSTLTYTTQPIADLMQRYAVEAETRDFALYLGDDRQGETHALSERS